MPERVRSMEGLGVIAKTQQFPLVAVLVRWVFKLTHWVVIVLLPFSSRSSQPELVVVSSETRYVFARDYVVLRRLKVVEANEDKEQICSVTGFHLLIQHPRLAATLNRLHLDAHALCRVLVRGKYVDAACVSQREGGNVSTPRQFGGDKVLSGDAGH